MNSYVWGSSMWNVLHGTSLLSPTRNTEGDRQLFSDVLSSFRKVCPCNVCKTSYGTFMSLPQFNLANPQLKPSVFAWELHNAVNTKLSRPLVRYEDVFRRYRYMVEPVSPAAVWQIVKPVASHAMAKEPEAAQEFVRATLLLSATLPQFARSSLMTELRAELGDFLDSGADEPELLAKLDRVEARVFGRCEFDWAKVDQPMRLDDLVA